jgi:hypothetical protein
MTVPGPSLEVPQPQYVARAIGTLLNTFEPVPVDDEHWELGYHFPTWGSCIDAFRWAPCSGVYKVGGSGSTTVETVPFTVYAPFKCSTFGFNEDDYRAAAQQALGWSGGTQLEQELWTGTLATQMGWPNRYLTDIASADNAGAGASGAYPWPVALALLQKALRECSGDVAGVIHASAALVGMWIMGGAVHEVDGVLMDRFGNFVIAGSGYSGNLSQSHITSVDGAPQPTSGTFTLTVTSPITGDAEATAAIAWDATIAAVQAALDALTIIEPGDVVVSGGPVGTAAVVYTWGGRFANQPVTMEVNSAGLDNPLTATITQTGGAAVVWGEEYAFATDIINVRAGEVQIIGDTVGQSLVRDVNDIEYIAEAAMSATWARCCHLYIRASLSDGCTFPDQTP